MKRQQFYDLLLERVFVPVLGEVTQTQVKSVVEGIVDVISTLLLEGASLRFGNMGTFAPHLTAGGWRWNPVKKTKFRGPKKTKVAFYQSRGLKKLFALKEANEKARAKSRRSEGEEGSEETGGG